MLFITYYKKRKELRIDYSQLLIEYKVFCYNISKTTCYAIIPYFFRVGMLNSCIAVIVRAPCRAYTFRVMLPFFNHLSVVTRAV